MVEPQPPSGQPAQAPPERAPGSPLHRRFPALQKLAFSKRRQRVPFIQQTTASDCGAASLTMVLAFHGKHLRLDDVRKVTGFGRDGADAMAILSAARVFGLRGRGVKVEEVEDLRFLPPGSILHWQFNHFLVLERLAPDGGADVVDPAGGRRRISREDLGRSFTGVALSFEPSEDFEPEEGGGKRRLGRFVKVLREHSNVLQRVIVTSGMVQLFALAVPLLIGALVDRVIPRGDTQLLGVLAVGLAAIVAFNFLSSLLRSYLLLYLRTHLDARMTLDFLDHLVDLPYAFFQQRSAGDLIMRMGSNTTVREILTSGALSGVLDGVLVTLYLILLFVASPSMGLLVVTLGAIRVALFLFTRKRTRDLMSRSLQTESRSQSYQVNLLAGIETLKAAGAEHRAVEQWSHLFVDVLNVSLSRGRLSAFVDSTLAALGTASPLIILVWGAVQVLQGDLTLGTMLAMNALAAGFLTPLSTLITNAFQFQLLGSYLDRIEDVLETPREQDPTTVSPAPRLKGGIRLEGVSFRYGPFAPLAVEDISIEIPPGRFVALVGRSGAGKSTLASLLVGLYSPTEGRILFDGTDLAELDLRSVRRQVGVVPQHPYLFGTSIRANITLSEPALPLSRAVEAAKLAHIHDDVLAMPMGYETLLADGGASLSGGQRQRLALARALVHRPAILLLDEATSALDTRTERDIQRELTALRTTRIVIAHRLSTIRDADLILVMDGGRLVEQGRHDELIALGGVYASLVAAQMEKERMRAAEV
ncbi:MAG TPA: peptidase domain-containing ABC transporter [Thermoanaerobaculia bacterium]|nr:peptidase domain-containing ABC transporter [Thermoanaerobaculia bacterium]